MAVLLANNAASLLAGPVDEVQTEITLSSGTGARFPAPAGGGDWFPVTLEYVSESAVVREILHCTGRNGDVLTVTRAREGTLAQTFPAGSAAELRFTKGVYDELVGMFDSTISAGNGLTGGGDLTANRTLALGMPSRITGTSSNSVTATSHNHEVATTESRSQNATSWILNAKAMYDHTRDSAGDHDGRYAQRSNNLSDLSSASSARNNLGLGSVATLNVIPANSVAGVNYDGQAAIWGSAWIGGEAMDGTNINSSTRPSGPYSDVDVVGTLPTGNFIGVIWHQRRGARPVQYAVHYGNGKFYSRGYGAGGWSDWLEYVDTTRNVHTGSGLQGGGNLGSDRTISVDSSVVRTTRRVDAGNGLTGGGNFGSDKTISMGTPGTITENTGNSTSSTSHTHVLQNSAIQRINASLSVGAVGTYALLRRNSTGGGTLQPGDTWSGSNLFYCNLKGDGAGSPPGTWRMMSGPLHPLNTSDMPRSASLALRIS